MRNTESNIAEPTKNSRSTELRITFKKQDKKSKGNHFIILVIVIALGIAGYRLIDSPNNSKTQIYNEYSNILEELQNRLVKGEQLNKAEWDEVCNLLHKVKDIQMYDCDSCHDYIRALLGGKHERHLKNYIEKSDKEILKGIKSYQKQIDLHYDKIANPEKHIPNWNNLHPDHRENSQNEKWQEDIARLKEQKRLFECILKNR